LSYRPVASFMRAAGRTVQAAGWNLAAPTVDSSGPVGKRDRTSYRAEGNREGKVLQEGTEVDPRIDLPVLNHRWTRIHTDTIGSEP